MASAELDGPSAKAPSAKRLLVKLAAADVSARSSAQDAVARVSLELRQGSDVRHELLQLLLVLVTYKLTLMVHFEYLLLGLLQWFLLFL